MKIREFSKDDWYGWAGAEEFKDGEPLIYEKEFHGTEFVAIADATGIEFHLICEEEDPVDMAFKVNVISKTQSLQKRLFNSLLDELHVDDDICGADLYYCLDHMDGVEAL
jgi:hypothetical protein